MKPTEQLEQLAEDHISTLRNACIGGHIIYAKKASFKQGYCKAVSQMQPEWVAVADAKPDHNKYYFALYSNSSGRLIKCVVVYTEGWDLVVECDGDEDHFNHDEAKELSYMPKGWYEECDQEGGMYDSMYFKRDVAFYLPNIELPQPPKDIKS